MKPSMEELLMEYRRTEAALRLRRDQVRHALRTQAKPKGDAVRRVAVLGEMLADVRITILEIEDYLDKAGTEEAKAGTKIVLLLPARTDTGYFHDYIYDKAQIIFLRGRLRFTDEDGRSYAPAPFPSMVVVYN